jgi:hypothetical protein
VGEQADDGPTVNLARVLLCGQVAVRPFGDDLVGGRKPRTRREDRPGVADGDAVAEQRALPCQRGGEVDRAEDQHSGARRIAGDEHLHARTAPLTVRAVGEHLAAPRGQQAERIVGDGGIGPHRPQSSLRRAGSDDEPAAHPIGIGMGDDGGYRNRPVGGDIVGHRLQLGKGVSRDRFDEDVHDPAAGEPDRERVVVGDPVALQLRGALSDNVVGQLVDGSLDAAARYRAAHRPVGRHHHRRARRPGSRGERPHHGADTRGAARLPDGEQIGQHVTHLDPLRGRGSGWRHPTAPCAACR